ncbi:IRR1 [Sanghuangporus weigelae]
MSLTTTMTIPDAERTAPPRRSTREKKVAQPFVLSSPSKRKRVGDADDDQQLSDVDVPVPGDSDEEDEYVGTRKSKTGAKGKARARGPPAPKKPRRAKPIDETGKAPTRRGRKPKEGAAATARVPAEAKISDDNTLFNSIMNPAAALQSTVEDFLDSFQQAPGPALADLITCILRTCGSNESVDADRAVDYDGIVDALDDFTEALKEDEAPTYPLTSKHPMFKKFRKSLSEFLTRLVQASAEMGTLYSSDLLMTIQAWVIAMSSSQLRSFRHTATVIALEIETALCDVAAEVEKEAELVTRQRDGERRRKGAKGAASGREKEFEIKAKEVKDRRAKLSEFLKEFFDGVFIHRYRDLDPSIRAECVHAMGEWLKRFPAHFLDNQYLRYIGWVLSDANNHVRLEAVRALVSLYAKEDYIVSLQSFTERFKPRLVEMATGDTEIPVRVAVVQVLSAVDAHGLLDESQRASLCLLVFDKDAKVRRAVSSFVRGVWDDATEQRLVGKKNPSEKEKKRAGLKALAQLLVQWGRLLDRASAESGEDLDGESSSQDDGPSATGPERSVASSTEQKSRIALAVEALWEEVEIVDDWEAMLDLLLLDHSAGTDPSQGGTPVSTRRKKTKRVVDDALVDEAWRLEEAEEAILLDVFVAALRKARAVAVFGKKGEDEAVASEITRELINALPRLIAKHQTDESRIANVLLIPELMNMDLYLEMRMVTAYESLWDDVSKQFLTHASPTVLANSIAAIRHFMVATSLSNTNSTKILELEDELATTLRDAVGGRDELEVATFSDDEAHVLGAICARICALAGSRDLTAWMEEDEGGKQSSAWDIICALAERGRLGYKEEELMVERALQLLSLHIIWKARHFIRAQDSSDKEQLQEALREQRDILLEKLTEYAVGTQSNTLLGVRRAAFQNLLTLYTLFSASSEGIEQVETPLAPLALSMGDEMQYRCAGFVQAEIERYAEELEGDRPTRHEESDAGSDSGTDSAPETSEKKTRGAKGKGKKVDHEEDVNVIKSRALLEQEYVLNATLTSFLRALKAGVIHARHGALLLAHYGRLGSAVDLSTRLMVDILREEGMAKDNGKLVVEVIVDSLRESFTLVLDRIVETEQHALGLAKALAPCLIMRGAQLSVIRKLASEYIVEIHTTLLSWITKKISAYETMKNKRGRNKSILFFKVLQHLLVGIDARDALNIKAHLDQDLAMLHIEIPPTSKAWEPYRAYEKRLSTASTKEKGHSKKAGKAGPGGAKSNDFVSSGDEEVEVDDIIETNGVASQPTARKVRPRPAFRKQPSQNGADGTQSELTELTEDERLPEPEPQPTQTRHSVNGTSASLVRPPSPSRLESTPAKRTPGRKRALSPDVGLGSTQEVAALVSPGGNTSPEPTQADEIVIRRKRVRH